MQITDEQIALVRSAYEEAIRGGSNIDGALRAAIYASPPAPLPHEEDDLLDALSKLLGALETHRQICLRGGGIPPWNSKDPLGRAIEAFRSLLARAALTKEPS